MFGKSDTPIESSIFGDLREGVVQQKLYSVELENFSAFGTVSNARLKSEISEFVFVFKGFGTCQYSHLPHFETHHSCNEYNHGGESS